MVGQTWLAHNTTKKPEIKIWAFQNLLHVNKLFKERINYLNLNSAETKKTINLCVVCYYEITNNYFLNIKNNIIVVV
jgi:hypothetical protein